MLSNCGDREDSWKSLERLLKVPWTARRSNQSILNKNQPWIFIGRTDAETQILWPPDVKNWLIRKEPYAGKDLGKGNWATEDEMVGCHHWLNGHELEQTLGDCEGQGSLTCCGSWGYTQSDTTKQLSNNNIWQQVMTNSVAGLRSSSKLFPKAKLAAKRHHGHCFMVCCQSEPLRLSESQWNH